MSDVFHNERETDLQNVVIVHDDMTNDKSKQRLAGDILSQFIK